MSLPLPLAPGTVIGRHYIVEALMNSGGFGAVYRGIDTSEGNRPCAIKETYDVTPAARRQALIEAGVLLTVRSKHLPAVYDALEENGRFYLIMQLIEGQNLLQLMRDRASRGQQTSRFCSEQEVLGWFLPIMDVLQELHSRNPAVVHRDIKPANIIVTPDSTAVLVDFGLTKLYDPNSNTQTMIKAVSEGFSPVEQYTGRTGPQSDIYSLVATMYFLLTNSVPPAALNRSVRDDLIAPHLLNPALSLRTERALLKALSVHADSRYQSIREFAQALKGEPFTAFADPTVVVSHASPRNGHTATVRPVSPSHIYSATPQHRQPGAGSATPVPPPGYAMMQQSAFASVQPLPNSFGQGCLWGLLQGVAAALLVLFLNREVYFYLAVLMGFLLYAIAGFVTTYRGGSSIRGSWSGFWAGIHSTWTFWIVLGLGLLIRLAQKIQTDTTDAPPDVKIGRAWNSVRPIFPHLSIVPRQPAWINVLILLGGGLVLASAFGWFGGILGTSVHKTQRPGRKQP
jgi:serine/threonine protein kinase